METRGSDTFTSSFLSFYCFDMENLSLKGLDCIESAPFLVPKKWKNKYFVRTTKIKKIYNIVLFFKTFFPFLPCLEMTIFEPSHLLEPFWFCITLPLRRPKVTILLWEVPQKVGYFGSYIPIWIGTWHISFYVQSIATYAPTFLQYNNSVLVIVAREYKRYF